LISGEDTDNHKVGRFWDTVYLFVCRKWQINYNLGTYQWIWYLKRQIFI